MHMHIWCTPHRHLAPLQNRRCKNYCANTKQTQACLANVVLRGMAVVVGHGEHVWAHARPSSPGNMFGSTRDFTQPSVLRQELRSCGRSVVRRRPSRSSAFVAQRPWMGAGGGGEMSALRMSSGRTCGRSGSPGVPDIARSEKPHATPNFAKPRRL